MESLKMLLSLIDDEWASLSIMYAEPWGIPWTVPPGERDDYEIHLLETGSGCFSVGGVQREAEPGDVVLLHSMSGNSFQGMGEFRLVFVTFKFDKPKNPERISAFNRLLSEEQMPLKLGENSGIRGMFYRMYRDMGLHADAHDVRLKLQLGALVMELLDACAAQDNHRDRLRTVSTYSHRMINEIILYLQEHSNTDINLDKLGKAMNLHPSYVCTIFKQATGDTISEFLRKLRIDKAKRLLLYTTMSITEIAFEVGFNNSQYFSKVFRRVMGMEPRAYRKARKPV